jgi:hypothetical protein
VRAQPPLNPTATHRRWMGVLIRQPATHGGDELIAAGMHILAADGRSVPLACGELERWARVGYERGTRGRQGER